MRYQAYLVGAILVLTTLPVAAQDAAPTEEVDVTAPYVVKMGTTSSGIKTVTMSSHVNYHDLDLTKDGDVATLQQRINDSAKTLCRKLENHYSTGTWKKTRQDLDCAKNASAGALAEADMVVAAARDKS